jgi:hypothetical protein
VRIVEEAQASLAAELLGGRPRDVQERPQQVDGRRERPAAADAGQGSRPRAANEPQEQRLGLVAPRVRRQHQRSAGLDGEPGERRVARLAGGRLQTGRADVQSLEPLEKERQTERLRERPDCGGVVRRSRAKPMIDVTDARLEANGDRSRQRRRIGAAGAGHQHVRSGGNPFSHGRDDAVARISHRKRF